MRIIRGIDISKSTLLKRLPAESIEPPPHVRQQIKEIFCQDLAPNEVVERIIQDIRARGDAALLEYVRKLDGAKLSQLEVHKEEIIAAHKNVDRQLLAALQTAAERIRDFHKRHRDLLPIGQIALMKGGRADYCTAGAGRNLRSWWDSYIPLNSAHDGYPSQSSRGR